MPKFYLPNLANILSKPEIAIGITGNTKGVVIRCQDRELGDVLPIRGNMADFARQVSKPEIAIGPFGDSSGKSIRGWEKEFFDLPSRCDAPDQALICLTLILTPLKISKPEIAIRATGDRKGLAMRC